MSELNLQAEQHIESVEDFRFEPIKGQPMLHWRGKRPFTSTQFYPAQLKETYGEETNGWINKIFWGDNLQVMSHLLKKYRGQVDLIYIDPPFDSKADYKKKIELRGKKAENDKTAFEEKQYTDIWTNDEYLQFMYERLILMRELLSDKGTIYLHCDWHKSHLLRMILDEVFGEKNIINEIVWTYKDIGSKAVQYFKRKHDTIFFYQKAENPNRIFNIQRLMLSQSTIDRYGSYFDENGQITYQWLKDNNPGVFAKLKGHPADLSQPWLDINNGQPLSDWWDDISPLKTHFSESIGYPTQKPEALLERIVKASTNPNDLVFDCFMGSGTTQSVAMKLGRRFIGADINLGAIDTTVKRLSKIAKDINETLPVDDITRYTGFELYNVNNYDVFRNPIQAKDLLIQALELQSLPGNNLYDGEKDGRMVKIMPINRIATRVDLNELITGFPRETFDKRKAESPTKPVELITLVCMGHEPDLAANLKIEMKNEGYNIDVEVIDILRDKVNLEFRRDSEADLQIEGD